MVISIGFYIKTKESNLLEPRRFRVLHCELNTFRFFFKPLCPEIFCRIILEIKKSK